MISHRHKCREVGGGPCLRTAIKYCDNIAPGAMLRVRTSTPECELSKSSGRKSAQSLLVRQMCFDEYTQMMFLNIVPCPRSQIELKGKWAVFAHWLNASDLQIMSACHAMPSECNLLKFKLILWASTSNVLYSMGSKFGHCILSPECAYRNGVKMHKI